MAKIIWDPVKQKKEEKSQKCGEHNIPDIKGGENYKKEKIGQEYHSLQRGGVGQGLRRDHWLVQLGSSLEDHFTRWLMQKAN